MDERARNSAASGSFEKGRSWSPYNFYSESRAEQDAANLLSVFLGERTPKDHTTAL
jgi:hypothetical protein